MDINGKNYKFTEIKITIPSSAPAMLELLFSCTELVNNQPVYTTHSILFTGENALQQYLNLNIHKKAYEKLCENLGVNLALIPSDIQNELPVQKTKSNSLKFLENLYCDFLQNEWTPKLKSIGLIASDAEITVQNTDASQNITYLLQLKAIDKNEYNYYAGEFSRLKSMIESEGGIMSEVERHQ